MKIIREERLVYEKDISVFLFVSFFFCALERGMWINLMAAPFWTCMPVRVKG